MRFVLPAILLAIMAVPAGMLLREERAPTPAVDVAADKRVRYPAGHYPFLTLPDGGRRNIRSLLNVDRPIRFGDYLWDDTGVPTGEVWVRVDLARQTLSVFRAGHEIGSTVILYGAEGKPTPPGVYPVLERAEHHRSSLYDAEMPYMLRLTADGVAVHASNVRASAATHGCIGVPLAFARLLFAQVRRGDIVAIIGNAPVRSPARPGTS